MTHYSDGTAATFQSLNNIRLENYLIQICRNDLGEGSFEGSFDRKIRVGDDFVFMNKNYTFDFNSKNRSFYFIENEKKLIRISDHWSEIIGDKKIKEVGSIRSCFWKLSQKNGIFYKHAVGEKEYYSYSRHKVLKKDVIMLAGFCMLKDMQKIIKNN